MIKALALVALVACLSPVADAEAMLQELPHGDSMQIVVTDDLPPLDNGDWQTGFVEWGSETIQLDPRVLEPEWRFAYGEDKDRLAFLVAHEWAHVMQDRAWLPELPLEPWITDPYMSAPTWMWTLYADDEHPWWEVHADCVAQVLTGVATGFYAQGGCTEVQRAHALYPLLAIGAGATEMTDSGEPMTVTPEPEYLSIPDAADYLGVSVTTAYRMVKRMNVPTYRSVVGNNLRVKTSDLDDLKSRLNGVIEDGDVRPSRDA